MVMPPTQDNRPFVEQTQPRHRLARVQDAGACPADCGHIAAGRGGNAGHALEEIEGNTLPGQQGAGRAGHFGNVRARDDVCAILDQRCKFDRGVNLQKALLGNHQACYHTGRFGQHCAGILQIVGNGRDRRDISAVARIFVQRTLDQQRDLLGQHAAPINGGEAACLVSRGRRIGHGGFPFLSLPTCCVSYSTFWTARLGAKLAIYCNRNNAINVQKGG